MNTTEKDNAIEKALHIMECFLNGNPELSNLEISEMLGYHKATTSRIVRTLTKRDFLYQNQLTKKYSLGNKIIYLSKAVRNSLDSNLVSKAQPHMIQLRNITGQNISLDVINGDTVVNSAVLTGTGPVIMNFPVGAAVPWNTSAGMRAILAFADNATRSIFFSKPMEPLTSTTITDLDTYRQELMKIKEKGYAFVESEPAESFNVLSMPIFSLERKSVASLSIVGTKDQVNEENKFYLDALKNAVDAVTADISLR